MSEPRRVLIVSNRLPFTMHVDGDTVICRPTSGGVASGLRVLHESAGAVWIGWPGDMSFMPRRHRALARAAMQEQRIVPVNLTRSESHDYYDGVCNSVLWPLLHYLVDRIPVTPASWKTYQEVNQRFADAVAAQYQPGDLIWIHDYHLMLVPGMLRAHLPHADIGFFLHVPFPVVDVFRILPWRHEILQGLLGASLIGFHTGQYATHFLETVRALTALEVEGGSIRGAQRTARVGVYPMGADAGWFSRAADSPAVSLAAAGITSPSDQRILLGVDRLDYTKGIPRRLLAYERLLQDHPELRGRVRMIQIAVPSRTGVASYERFRHEVETTVSRINGEMGRVGWTPIEYLYQSVSPTQLVALYRAADVMLVTPLRDGMNLVAKEYVAARTDNDGVLMLSEFAGAADELPEALSVNPYDIEEIACAMARALAMGPGERRHRMMALRRSVNARDIHWWTSTFTHDLAKANEHVTALATRDRCVLAPAMALPPPVLIDGRFSDSSSVRRPALTARAIA